MLCGNYLALSNILHNEHEAIESEINGKDFCTEDFFKPFLEFNKFSKTDVLYTNSQIKDSAVGTCE